MLGVAVRGVGARDQVALLRAGRHAGRRARALHVEHHGRNFGEIGEPEEFLHQRDAGPGGRGERAGAVPGRADHHADRGKLVLGLHDGDPVLLGLGIDAQPLAMAGKGVGQRGRGRDRVPGAHRGAAIDRAQRGCRVALDEDAVADRVGAAQAKPDRALQVHQRPVAPEMKRMQVRLDQLFLRLELLLDQLLEHLDLHVEQRGERADIDDVLEQLALAQIGVFAIADRGQRHADDRDVLAELRLRHRLGGVVEQVSAGLDPGDVLVPGLRIHRDHEVGAAARAEVAGFRDAHLVPGRQALDVGGEDVARRDRNAHAHHRAREQLVGAGGARTVDVGETDDEVVYAADRAATRHRSSA